MFSYFVIFISHVQVFARKIPSVVDVSLAFVLFFSLLIVEILVIVPFCCYLSYCSHARFTWMNFKMFQRTYTFRTHFTSSLTNIWNFENESIDGKGETSGFPHACVTILQMWHTLDVVRFDRFKLWANSHTTISCILPHAENMKTANYKQPATWSTISNRLEWLHDIYIVPKALKLICFSLFFLWAEILHLSLVNFITTA